MKKTLLGVLASVIFLIGAIALQTTALAADCATQVLLQGQPNAPAMCVGVALTDVNGTPSTTFASDEEIWVRISLENVGLPDIVTSAHFLETKFHLLLRFTYIRPDGTKELITTNYPEKPDSMPPPSLEGANYEQAEEFTVLQGTGSGTPFPWVVDPFNAMPIYPGLDRPGRYEVKLVIPMRTYPSPPGDAFLPDNCQNTTQCTHVLIAGASWEDNLQSNTVGFELVSVTDFSALGKPAALEMIYDGTGCGAPSSWPDAMISCSGDPEGASPVYIIASENKNPKKTKYVYFEGPVYNYAQFWIDAVNAGERVLESETWIFIYDYNVQTGEPGALLQKVGFHSSASEPLIYKSKFGGTQLVGYRVAPPPGG
jgi:hypothetical protein